MRVRRAPAELRESLAIVAADPADVGRADHQEHFRCAGCGILAAVPVAHVAQHGAAIACAFCGTINVPALRDTP